MNSFLEKYKSFRDEVDNRCDILWGKHHKQMQCRAGCASCCQSFKILPVEFEFIKAKINLEKLKINRNASADECVFLVNNKCSIYEHRPIICRTHGYPLVRLNEELEEYEVSFCPLNFKEYPIENFNNQNVFFEDKFNSQLFQINKGFLEDSANTEFDNGQLIPLRDLLDSND